MTPPPADRQTSHPRSWINTWCCRCCSSTRKMPAHASPAQETCARTLRASPDTAKSSWVRSVRFSSISLAIYQKRYEN